MLEYLLLIVGLLRATLRSRGNLIAENLFLRQQLAALTRPTRKRPRPRASDKAFWLLARLVRGDWRRHVFVVTLRRSSAGTAGGLAARLGLAVPWPARPSTAQRRGPGADRSDGAR